MAKKKDISVEKGGGSGRDEGVMSTSVSKVDVAGINEDDMVKLLRRWEEERGACSRYRLVCREDLHTITVRVPESVYGMIKGLGGTFNGHMVEALRDYLEKKGVGVGMGGEVEADGGAETRTGVETEEETERELTPEEQALETARQEAWYKNPANKIKDYTEQCDECGEEVGLMWDYHDHELMTCTNCWRTCEPENQ